MSLFATEAMQATYLLRRHVRAKYLMAMIELLRINYDLPGLQEDKLQMAWVPTSLTRPLRSSRKGSRTVFTGDEVVSSVCSTEVTDIVTGQLCLSCSANKRSRSVFSP